MASSARIPVAVKVALISALSAVAVAIFSRPQSQPKKAENEDPTPSVNVSGSTGVNVLQGSNNTISK